MTVLEQIDLKKVPDEGYLLAYFRSELVFFYQSGIRELLEKKGLDHLLELHVFDEKEEYRLLRTGKGKWIEVIVSDEKVQKEKKVECVKLEKEYEGVMKYLNVINYIDYDENGMISINQYRLAPVEKWEGGCQ